MHLTSKLTAEHAPTEKGYYVVSNDLVYLGICYFNGSIWTDPFTYWFEKVSYELFDLTMRHRELLKKGIKVEIAIEGEYYECNIYRNNELVPLEDLEDEYNLFEDYYEAMKYGVEKSEKL